MSFETATWAAILGMGLITYALRIAGPIFLRGVELETAAFRPRRERVEHRIGVGGVG